VIAGFQPLLGFLNQFIGRLYAHCTPCTSGKTLHQTPSLGHGHFSLSGDMPFDMQLLDAIQSEGFSTEWTGHWTLEIVDTSIEVSALVGKYPLLPTLSKRRDRKP
jgi:hypothetical protein